MRPLRVLTMLTVVGAALVAGCGDDGGGNRLSSEEYSQRYNAVDMRMTRTLDKIKRAPGTLSKAEGRAALEAISAEATRSADTLEKVKPPTEAQDIHERLTADYRALAKEADALLAQPDISNAELSGAVNSNPNEPTASKALAKITQDADAMNAALP
jgi:hypothetical protein